MSKPNRIACFFSTSGHSGVDRAVQHLIPELSARGYEVDLLHIHRHGPYLKSIPEGVRVIDLGTSSTYSSLFPLIRYLRRERPVILFSDKDRVNRTAMLAVTCRAPNPARCCDMDQRSRLILPVKGCSSVGCRERRWASSTPMLIA